MKRGWVRGLRVVKYWIGLLSGGSFLLYKSWTRIVFLNRNYKQGTGIMPVPSDCRQKLSENALSRHSDSFSFMRTENLRLFQ